MLLPLGKDLLEIAEYIKCASVHLSQVNTRTVVPNVSRICKTELIGQQYA